MVKLDEIRAETRRKAQERLAAIKQENTKSMQEYERQRKAESAKTSRLRELRLAKEAVDRKNGVVPAPAPVIPPAAKLPAKAAARPRRAAAKQAGSG